jgi:hypothetical protein
MSAQACPTCGEARLGYLRFCRLCGFDYDRHETDPIPGQPDVPRPMSEDEPVGTDSTPPTPPPETRRDAVFEPFDLFPDRMVETDAAPGGILTGVMVIAGIVVVFVALLVLRPLG